jgi:beta-lactam-binding protein with PASTA domain
VPNVVGMTQPAASVTLSQVYLNVGTVSQVYSSTVPAGSVISQSVAAGTTLPYGSFVNLVVSIGASPTAPVPYVVGMTQADAQSTLISANLTVGTISQAYSGTVASGNVISQNPASGISVAMGSAVDLTVSIGPQPETVPNVVGMTQSAASVTLSQVYLNVGTVSQEYSSTVPAWLVISQSVEAGTTLPYGSYVNLVISLGPQ